MLSGVFECDYGGMKNQFVLSDHRNRCFSSKYSYGQNKIVIDRQYLSKHYY